MTGLGSLSLVTNQISDISPLIGMRSLHFLDLNNNMVEDIKPLSGMTSLWELLMGNNQYKITDLTPIATLTGLTSLNLNYSAHIGDNITLFSGLTRLYYLNLAGTMISDVEPLLVLDSVISLDVSENEISNLELLAGMSHLQNLRLMNSAMSDITWLEPWANPGGGPPMLKKLYLTGNPLDCHAYRSVIPALEAKGITVLRDAMPDECLNQPPAASAGGPYAGHEGSEVSFDGTGSSDPDGDTIEYAWDFGDGANGSGATPTHTYADNGTYTVSLTVTDPAGALDTQYTAAEITNIAPMVGPIDGPMYPIQLGTSIVLYAEFIDPGMADTHSAEWDWGDGSIEAATLDQGAGSGSVEDFHNYTQAGIYTVGLTVTDNDGGSAESEFRYVVAYDPEGGFVTGGGWIDSPSGAYTPDDPEDDDLTGKANFGFVSKYKSGATVPTGQTEFVFQAGDLNFHSSSYQWLVVNQDGTNAQFKGSGAVNGTGDYKFMLWAGDGAPDTFRIRIWEEDEASGDETDVYDNGSEQAISGGSIVVHTK